jgi:hypothetical protein
VHARSGQLLPTSAKQQHEALFQRFESYLGQLQADASTSKQLSVAQAREAFVQQHDLSEGQQHGLDFMINTRIEQVGVRCVGCSTVDAYAISTAEVVIVAACIPC